MPTHKVDGAILHYEVFGSGPLLVMIPGADGRGSIFHDVAKILSADFTVVCWDRRGYSKSLLIGPQDFASRLSIDADDAHSLITHLGSPAFVFGTSSGAIVATKLLERHTQSVRAVVAYEPPSFTLLPEEYSQKATGLLQQVYETYRKHGVQAAMELFTGGLSEGDDAAAMRQCMDITRSDEIRANAMFWLEFELRHYPGSPLNMEAIVNEKEKYVLAAGVVSGNGPGVGPAAVIAGKIGKDIVRFPGGHVSHMTDAEGFSQVLSTTLKGF